MTASAASENIESDSDDSGDAEESNLGGDSDEPPFAKETDYGTEALLVDVQKQFRYLRNEEQFAPWQGHNLF